MVDGGGGVVLMAVNSSVGGIVARNSVESLLTCFGKKWRCDSALAAELQAIRSICALSANKGWLNVIIESDSQTAITLATTENVPHRAVSALIMDIRYWTSYTNLPFLWTLRMCNHVAHHVARITFSLPDSFT
nr:ribonuclease H protein [Tanacetum cinerariifolium]